MTQTITFYIISNYIIDLSLNGQTNVSPGYLKNLVMRELKHAERDKKLDRNRSMCWSSQHDCDANATTRRKQITYIYLAAK